MVSDPPLATPHMPIVPGCFGSLHLFPFPGKLPKYLPPVINHMTALWQCDTALAVLIILAWAPGPCHLILGKIFTQCLERSVQSRGFKSKVKNSNADICFIIL